MGALVYFGRLPFEILLVYITASCIAFFVYGRDKSAARNGKWRISEHTLHVIGFLGGWPGALLAQKFFHHKSRKVSFQVVFWITVIGNCALAGWFLHGRL